MSHITTVKSAIKDFDVLEETCKQLKIKYNRSAHTVQMFDGSKKTNFSVHLDGWRYPVLVDEDGTVKFDNYNGNWGHISSFENLQLEYNKRVIEKVAIEQGMTFDINSYETASDGSIVMYATKY